MGNTIQLPDWSRSYQVAAFGAYAAILVESIYLIYGGCENMPLLSISILTNGSALLLAGFGGPPSTPCAIIQICLMSLFLLGTIILKEMRHLMEPMLYCVAWRISSTSCNCGITGTTQKGHCRSTRMVPRLIVRHRQAACKTRQRRTVTRHTSRSVVDNN